MLSPSRNYCCNYPNTVFWKFPIMQISPVSCHFLPVRCARAPVLYTDCPVTLSILEDLIEEIISHSQMSSTSVQFSTVTELRMFKIQDLCILQHLKFDNTVPVFCLRCVRISCLLWDSKVSEDRWPHWPVLQATTTNPSVRELTFQVFCDVLTEIWGVPSGWKCTWNRVYRHAWMAVLRVVQFTFSCK
jgi:hypothetical protein